jgi:hypothetical protein
MQVYVDSIEHLKLLSKIGKYAKFYVIHGSNFHIVKRIRYFPRKQVFNVISGFDGYRQIGLTEAMLHEKTNIPEAIEKGALLRVFE